ncbi:MAG TPA: hydantoinase/oxoprolinase family protein [Methylomirabilota bacterium]|nr:hydantoinase/oxoprolinase family protein [Methylomirabilota bacterium]
MMVVGIDVGGTFTDVTAVDDATGAVRLTKIPSAPRDEARPVLKGLAELAIALPAVRRIVHGTTVGTNAILERRGARVALVTTAGFRDLIEIGRTKRNIPALFDPTFVRPKPLVPRPLRFEVDERILHDGSVARPLGRAELESVVARLAPLEPEAFAVCGLHAYANPAHEQAVGEALRQAFPGRPVSLSSEVVPEYREFERFSTTVLNAYVQPLMDRYLDALERELIAAGSRTGVLTVGSNGGALTLAMARRLPIKTVASGPAAGVSRAVAVGRRAGIRDLVTYDMGGTSTDVCLVQDLAPLVTTDTLIAAFPVKIPQVDIKSVGAGGGSLAWVDVDGALQVGPRSAGADPGPACYGLGGLEATVTDADILLGRIGTARPLGGAIRLDPGLSRRAFERLAVRVPGLDPPRLAEGVIRIAVARMTASIREITLQRGHDPRDFTLVAFGGAGPMHAGPVAEELGMTRILVPAYPGNFSALGLLASDIKLDAVRTRITRLAEAELPALGAAFAAMRADAAARLAAEGFGLEAMGFETALDLRYVGQAFELTVPVDPPSLTVTGAAADFHARHLAMYGHADAAGAVEIVNLRLVAYGVVAKPDLLPYGARAGGPEEARIEVRPVHFEGELVACPVYQRERLGPGVRLAGPAIVEEFGATTVLFPHWHATVDPVANLLLERSP